MFMKTFTSSLEKAGIELSLVDSGLKLSAPKGKITPDILAQIKKHKFEIISFISKSHHQEDRAFNKLPFEPSKESGGSPLPTCWDCHHYDGMGLSWPGICRYFEQLGLEAKKIDSNAVDPGKGCRFFQKATQDLVTAPPVK